jgi:hypothetical protein
LRGLDTDVLLRYIAADEPRQLALAERVPARHSRNQDGELKLAAAR